MVMVNPQIVVNIWVVFYILYALPEAYASVSNINSYLLNTKDFPENKRQELDFLDKNMIP